MVKAIINIMRGLALIYFVLSLSLVLVLMADQKQKDGFAKMIRLFKLDSAVNRSSTAKKSHDQIKSDYERWRKISEVAKNK